MNCPIIEYSLGSFLNSSVVPVCIWEQTHSIYKMTDAQRLLVWKRHMSNTTAVKVNLVGVVFVDVCEQKLWNQNVKDLSRYKGKVFQKYI